MPFSGGNLGALGYGISQSINPAYDEAIKQAGQVALGKTLQMLGGGQQFGQGPMGQPGQPGQPPQQPPMAGGPPQGPPPQMGGPPPMPQGPPPIGGPPQGGMATPPMQRPPSGPPIGPPGGQAMPQQPGMQPPPQMQPQGFGPQQQGGGPLDWRQIFQMVMRANPGAPPAVIAAAVNGAIPIMNAQSQMEWKNYIAPQLAQQRMAVQERGQDISADVRERGQDVTARGQDIRADTAAGAQDVARRGQDIRADTAQKQIVSRETIAKMTIDERREAYQAGIISKQQMDEANRNERGREADQRVGATIRGQDVRADTAAKAESGRMQRAELSNATKQELGKLSMETRREIAAASEAGKDYRTSYQEGARTQRTELSNEAKKEIASLSVQARKEITEYVEGGRMERSEQARTSRENIAERRDETTRRGQDVRAETAKAGQEGTQRRFDIKEARITAHQAVTADQAWQRLDQQRKALQARIKEGKDRSAIAMWRTILDAQHKRTTEIISAWSQNNMMDPAEKKQLLKDADDAYEREITGIATGGGQQPSP